MTGIETLQEMKKRLLMEKRQTVYTCDKNLEIEQDYLIGEPVKVNFDVFNMTIAAIMTENCSKEEIAYCMKQSFLVFMCQSLLVVSYAT